jgi:tripartite-type tricarboxylate transporter receptor subunit TctC
MKRVLLAASVAVLALTSPLAAQNYPWKPAKPITVIVPWGAGGSTDQIVRVLAKEIEGAIGQTVVVVNQPGASGSIGTKSALDAAKDGYTWTSGAAKDMGTYAVTGLLNSKLSDFHLFLGVINAAVISVNAATPYQKLDDLIKAMKEKPGAITFATAGINSSGGNALGTLSQAAGVQGRQVTYDGGNPAVIATAGGETQATPQLAVEQAEMLRAKRIRALAVMSSKSLIMDGVPEIPAVTALVPGIRVADDYFGIFVPKGVPDEVVKTLEMIWKDKMANSEALKKYAQSRGAIVSVVSGEDAQKAAMPAVQTLAWGLWDRKEAKVQPDTVGIPRP